MAITSGFQPDDVGSTPSSRSSSYNEFIGIYDGYFTDEFIDNTLNWYNTAKKQGLIHTRRGHLVSDDAVGLLAQDYLDQIDGCVPMTYRLGPFTEMYWRAQEEYANQYPMLHEYDAQGIIDAKIQHTKAGEGYHVWHSEAAHMSLRNRIITWMLYLNDDFEGGETEFLYQKLRIQPKRGRLLIWPAAYTHVHRGGLVLKGSKFVMTGWVEVIHMS